MHKHHRTVREILYSLDQLRNELRIITTRQVVYYFDFNLLHPYLYRQTEERYRWLDAIGSCLFTLNSYMKKPRNVHVCLSIPTAMEFIYSLERHHQNYISHLRDSRASEYVHRCMVELEKGSLRMSDIQSSEIKSFILGLTGSKFSSSRVSNFLRSFAQDKVDMLTDHYSSNEINKIIRGNRDTIDKILHTMTVNRGEKDQRSGIKRLIAYRADSHNIFLTKLNESDNERVINFVCSGRLYHWAPYEVLRNHQRSALFLVMLIGLLGGRPDDPPFEEKVRRVENHLNESIRIGSELIQATQDHEHLPIDVELTLNSFLYTNIQYYIDMAKDISKTSIVSEDFLSIGDVSYRDYIEMVDGKRSALSTAISSIHNLVEDPRDEMYRDFVDDDRIKAAFPSLNLR